jgi:hypothetical protein
MIELSAYIICAIFAIFTVFQFLLILGAPLGKYTQGGYHVVLPTGQRIICAISIILYFVFALIILNQAGLVDVFGSISNVGIWVLTVFFFLNTFVNGVSRSKQERAVMTPVAFVLALLCLFLAVN